MKWTHIKDQDDAAKLLPAWLGRRLIGLRGRFGLLLLLTTGDAYGEAVVQIRDATQSVRQSVGQQPLVSLSR
jgi:hypothetical protein